MPALVRGVRCGGAAASSPDDLVIDVGHTEGGGQGSTRRHHRRRAAQTDIYQAEVGIRRARSCQLSWSFELAQRYSSRLVLMFKNELSSWLACRAGSFDLCLLRNVLRNTALRAIAKMWMLRGAAGLCEISPIKQSDCSRLGGSASTHASIPAFFCLYRLECC